MPVKNTPIKKLATEEPVVKLPMDIDEPDNSISVLDDKAEAADPLLASDEETDEFASDEMGLEEEIDPFGDKWEA